MELDGGGWEERLGAWFAPLSAGSPWWEPFAWVGAAALVTLAYVVYMIVGRQRAVYIKHDHMVRDVFANSLPMMIILGAYAVRIRPGPFHYYAINCAFFLIGLGGAWAIQTAWRRRDDRERQDYNSRRSLRIVTPDEGRNGQQGEPLHEREVGR